MKILPLGALVSSQWTVFMFSVWRSQRHLQLPFPPPFFTSVEAFLVLPVQNKGFLSLGPPFLSSKSCLGAITVLGIDVPQSPVSDFSKDFPPKVFFPLTTSFSLLSLGPSAPRRQSFNNPPLTFA